jgi:hypothetical protein
MKKGGRNYMKHIIRDKTAYAYKGSWLRSTSISIRTRLGV